MRNFKLLGSAVDLESHRLDGLLGIVPNMAVNVNTNGDPIMVAFSTDIALGGPFDHHCTLEVYVDGVYTGYGSRAEVEMNGPSRVFPHAFTFSIPVSPGEHLVEIRYSKYTGSVWVNNGGRLTALSVWG